MAECGKGERSAKRLATGGSVDASVHVCPCSLQVRGVHLSRVDRDALCVGVDCAMSRRGFRPIVDPNLYRLSFVPVFARAANRFSPMTDYFVVQFCIDHFASQV